MNDQVFCALLDKVHFDRVCHLAGELVEGLKKNSEHKTHLSVTTISQVDTLCVKIAALCYNLGKNSY